MAFGDLFTDLKQLLRCNGYGFGGKQGLYRNTGEYCLLISWLIANNSLGENMTGGIGFKSEMVIISFNP